MIERSFLQKGSFHTNKPINIIHDSNKCMEQKWLVTSIGSKNAFGKIQQPFLIKRQVK